MRGQKTQPVNVRVPVFLLEKFDKRYPVVGARRALVNAAFRAAVSYPELAARLMKQYEGQLIEEDTDEAAPVDVPNALPV